MPRRVVVSDELARQLLEPALSVELYDPQGRLLGKFVTPEMEEIERKWLQELTEEEIQRQIAAGGKTTAEVLADLEKLK